MVQLKNRNEGGEEIASASVLKLVMMVHRIGKKIAKPMIQARMV